MAASPPQPPPPPQAWFPSVAPRKTPQALVAILVVAIILFSIFPFFLGAGTGSLFPGMFAAFLCVPFLFVIIVILFAVMSSSSQRRIPPPPPIQGPMVPAGQQGPVALNCPNCGAPPVNVDRFGVATCSYCGTRFLVR